MDSRLQRAADALGVSVEQMAEFAGIMSPSEMRSVQDINPKQGARQIDAFFRPALETISRSDRAVTEALARTAPVLSGRPEKAPTTSAVAHPAELPSPLGPGATA